MKESGREGFLEEVGIRGKRGRHPRMGEEQVPGFRGRNVMSLNKARCSFGPDVGLMRMAGRDEEGQEEGSGYGMSCGPLPGRMRKLDPLLVFGVMQARGNFPCGMQRI